jgi:DNA-binding MarR family transcriptional regulator
MDYNRLAGEHINQVATHFRKGLIFDRYNKFAKGELFILNYLTQCGETALPSEISEKSGSSTARIANALGVLEQKGLITRDMDKKDRRKIIVSITEKGKELIQNERDRLVNSELRIFRAMGEKDAAEFVRLQKRYLDLTEREE